MIKSLKLENFMSIKEGTIIFDSTNIVSLCGYNDSGKSAFVRALEILFYDAHKTEQVHYIQDEEQEFILTLTFRDGVKVQKTKKRSGKSLWLMTNKAGDILYTNKKQNAIVSVQGVPDIIAKYLGVILDPTTGEFLNVRTRSSRLFLIETSGGDNYKILNEFLQTQVLSLSSVALLKDKNALGVTCKELSLKKTSLIEDIEETKYLSDKKTKRLELSLARLQDLRLRYERTTDLLHRATNIKRYTAPKELIKLSIEGFKEVSTLKSFIPSLREEIRKPLNLIDTTRLFKLKRIKGFKTDLSLHIPPELHKVSVTSLETLSKLIELKGSLSLPVERATKKVPTERFKEVSTLRTQYTALMEIDKKIKKVSGEIASLRRDLEEKARGHRLLFCDKCGSYVQGGEA